MTGEHLSRPRRRSRATRATLHQSRSAGRKNECAANPARIRRRPGPGHASCGELPARLVVARVVSTARTGGRSRVRVTARAAPAVRPMPPQRLSSQRRTLLGLDHPREAVAEREREQHVAADTRYGARGGASAHSDGQGASIRRTQQEVRPAHHPSADCHSRLLEADDAGARLERGLRARRPTPVAGKTSGLPRKATSGASAARTGGRLARRREHVPIRDDGPCRQARERREVGRLRVPPHQSIERAPVAPSHDPGYDRHVHAGARVCRIRGCE
jgi:hypothetical protein